MGNYRRADSLSDRQRDEYEQHGAVEDADGRLWLGWRRDAAGREWLQLADGAEVSAVIRGVGADSGITFAALDDDDMDDDEFDDDAEDEDDFDE